MMAYLRARSALRERGRAPSMIDVMSALSIKSLDNHDHLHGANDDEDVAEDNIGNSRRGLDTPPFGITA